MIQLLTTASIPENCAQLKRSLDHFGWSYHFIHHEWRGFGDKIIKVYDHLKANPHITHFFYSDAFDTFCLDTMEEALRKVKLITKDLDTIIISAERACYPHGEKAVLYPEVDSPWKYVNGGGWFASSEKFCKMVECKPIAPHEVDQIYFTDRFLEGVHGIKLDNFCKVFQTIGHCPETDFRFELGGGINAVHMTRPVFWHGNGRTPMDHIYKLI